LVKILSKDKLLLFEKLPWLTHFITAPCEVEGHIDVSLSIFCCSCFLTFRWQGIIRLIVEKEGSHFTGKRKNALYEAVMPSEDSGSQIHKSDNQEKSRLCSSLLLYRLVDAIYFSKNYSANDSILPRQIFSNLNIPVSRLLQYSAEFLKLITIRAGMDSAVIGRDLSGKREIRYIYFR
jgi:hypothetical protein